MYGLQVTELAQVREQEHMRAALEHEHLTALGLCPRRGWAIGRLFAAMRRRPATVAPTSSRIPAVGVECSA